MECLRLSASINAGMSYETVLATAKVFEEYVTRRDTRARSDDDAQLLYAKYVEGDKTVFVPVVNA